MSFIIDFGDESEQYPYDNPEIPAAAGWLVLGDQTEGFLSNLKEWDRNKYRHQWRSSLAQIAMGKTKAVLITDYLSPEVGSYLEWWSLFRGDSSLVYVQNQLVVYERLGQAFSVENASDFLGERTTLTETGTKVSEWTTTVEDIANFLARVESSAEWRGVGGGPGLGDFVQPR